MLPGLPRNNKTGTCLQVLRTLGLRQMAHKPDLTSLHPCPPQRRSEQGLWVSILNAMELFSTGAWIFSSHLWP